MLTSSELLDKVIVIADFKISLPLLIRTCIYMSGVYVQRGQMEDGSTEYAAGGDMFVPDLVFGRSPLKGRRVIKYVPGDWEKALDRLFSKVQRLRAAIEASDKKAFVTSLQEGLDIADVDKFTRLAEAGFKELVGR